MLWVLSVIKIFIWHPQFFPTVLKCPKIAGACTHSTCAKFFLRKLSLFYSFIEKTPVGSPSARRLTRSNEKPAETRDLRKRSKTGAGSKNPPGLYLS